MVIPKVEYRFIISEVRNITTQVKLLKSLFLIRIPFPKKKNLPAELNLRRGFLARLSNKKITTDTVRVFESASESFCEILLAIGGG
jgi:hypothetical protein